MGEALQRISLGHILCRVNDRAPRHQDIARTVRDLGVMTNRLTDYYGSDPEVVATEFADLIETAAAVLRLIDRIIADRAPP